LESSKTASSPYAQSIRRLGFLLEPPVPVMGCARRPCWEMKGDYWFAGRFEKRLFQALFRKTFGVYFGVDSRIIVFHRIPAPLGEYAVEVFGEATRLGVIEYSPRTGWVYYPSGAAASIDGRNEQHLIA